MNKRFKEQYTIDILGMGHRESMLVFDIDDSFFAHFDYGLIEKGKLQTKISVAKSETMIQLHFCIKGNIVLICDRSLEPFDYAIDIPNEMIILKYGHQHEVLSDELETIAPATQNINVAQYIYEFITLQVPIKKLHPKLVQADKQRPKQEDAEGNLLIYTTHSTALKEEEEPTIDPRWLALKKIKDKN